MGYSLLFDGASDYAILNPQNQAEFTDSQDFTISVWYRGKEELDLADNSYRVPLITDDDSTIYVQALALDAGKPLFEFQSPGHSFAPNPLTTPVVNTGSWHQITLVSSGGTVAIYVDGELKGGPQAYDVAPNEQIRLNRLMSNFSHSTYTCPL